MLEFALLISIVFVVTLTIVDIARFMMLEAILNRGAEEGLNVATKISNYDLDIRDLSVTDSRYYDFYEARRRVLDAATRVPLETFFTGPAEPSSAQLIEFEQRDEELQGVTAGTEPRVVKAAAVVRPGEIAYRTDDPAQFVTNVKKGIAPGETLPPRPWSMVNGLRNSPIQVELPCPCATSLSSHTLSVVWRGAYSSGCCPWFQREYYPARSPSIIETG